MYAGARGEMISRRHVVGERERRFTSCLLQADVFTFSRVVFFRGGGGGGIIGMKGVV